jgi:hypothetical protein
MNVRNRDSCRQLFETLQILPLKNNIFFPFYYLSPKIEIYINRVQKFIISTPDLVLTYILQLQT